MFESSRRKSEVSDRSSDRGRDYLWGLWAIAPFTMLAIRDLPFGPGYTAGDYAQYLLHAKALVDGRPYDDTGYIYSMMARNIGPPAFPIGLPLTLAPFVAVFGPTLGVLRPLMILTGVAALWVAFLALRRHVSAAPAALGVSLAGAFIGSSQATRVVGSDLGFSLLVWLLVLHAGRIQAPTWRNVAGFVALAVAAFLYRSIGLAVFLAVPMQYFVNIRSWSVRMRVKLGLAIGVLVTTLAGIVAYHLLPDVLPPHRHALWFAITRGLRLYGSVAPKLAGTPLGGDGRYVWAIFAAGAMILAIPEFWRRSGRSYLVALVLVYSGILLLAPVREPRYLWPLAPVGATLFSMGLFTVARRYGARAGAAVVGLVMFITVVDVGRILRGDQPPVLLDHPDVRELFQWMRNTRRTEHDRVVFFNPRVLTLVTGIPAMGIPEGPEDLVRTEMARQGITLVVLGDLGTAPETQREFARLLRGMVSAQPPAHRNRSFSVYLLPRRPDGLAKPGLRASDSPGG